MTRSPQRQALKAAQKSVTPEQLAYLKQMETAQSKIAQLNSALQYLSSVDSVLSVANTLKERLEEEDFAENVDLLASLSKQIGELEDRVTGAMGLVVTRGVEAFAHVRSDDPSRPAEPSRVVVARGGDDGAIKEGRPVEIAAG